MLHLLMARVRRAVRSAALPIALTACGVHLPPPPAGVDRPLSVDRTSLPDLPVYAADTCRVDMPDNQARAGGDRHLHASASTTAFVLQHPTEGVVVIDTGFGRRTLADPRDYPGKLSVKLLHLEMRAPLVDQLPALGLAASDVRHVFLTHLHTDHVGGIEDLPNAELHVDAEEWRWARKKRALHGVDPVPYEGRANTPVTWVEEPYGPFPIHSDVFGDGTIILLRAPGHTPGSTMVLVNGRDHSWLFTGDAAWVDANWREPVPKGALPRKFVEVDWREGVDTLWRVRSMASDPSVTVISGHEPANVERFSRWPEPLVPWANTP